MPACDIVRHGWLGTRCQPRLGMIRAGGGIGCFVGLYPSSRRPPMMMNITWVAGTIVLSRRAE
jgi:hypothetical protein